MQTPYYLTPNSDLESDVIFNIPILANPTMSTVNYKPQEMDSMWASIAGIASETVEGAATFVSDTVKGLGNAALEGVNTTASSLLSTFLPYLLIIAGVLIAVIWVGGKSGAFQAIAMGLKP